MNGQIEVNNRTRMQQTNRKKNWFSEWVTIFAYHYVHSFFSMNNIQQNSEPMEYIYILRRNIDEKTIVPLEIDATDAAPMGVSELKGIETKLNCRLEFLSKSDREQNRFTEQSKSMISGSKCVPS